MSEPAAWFVAYRLHEEWNEEDPEISEVPAELDEVYIGTEPRKP